MLGIDGVRFKHIILAKISYIGDLFQFIQSSVKTGFTVYADIHKMVDEWLRRVHLKQTVTSETCNNKKKLREYALTLYS